ncbi:MAG TPA: hypothetical protein VN455_10700 [Methanotrichaceae archaeon]|nr:hypothetical protein [Methanotrichaceae archaeon]
MPGSEGSQTPPCPSCQGKGYILNFAGPEPTQPCQACKSFGRANPLCDYCGSPLGKTAIGSNGHIFCSTHCQDLYQIKERMGALEGLLKAYQIETRRLVADVNELRQQIKGRTFTPLDLEAKVKELESRLDSQTNALSDHAMGKGFFHEGDELAPFGPAEIAYLHGKKGMLDEMFGVMGLKRIKFQPVRSTPDGPTYRPVEITVHKGATSVTGCPPDLESAIQFILEEIGEKQTIGDVLRGHPCTLAEDRKLYVLEQIASEAARHIGHEYHDWTVLHKLLRDLEKLEASP